MTRKNIVGDIIHCPCCNARLSHYYVNRNTNLTQIANVYYCSQCDKTFEVNVSFKEMIPFQEKLK